MARKTILEIAEDYGLEIQKEGRILRAFCPFHNDTGRPNFTLYEETDSWFCFACNEGGDDVDFVSKIEGISKSEAFRRLRVDIQIDENELQQKIDGLYLPTEEPTFNEKTDFLVSRYCRDYLIKYPGESEKVLEFLKYVDSALETPITFLSQLELIKKMRETLSLPV